MARSGPFLYHLLTVCCVGLCCGLFAFIVLTIPKGEGYEPDPGDGDFCVDLDAVACVPYICDQRNGLCLTSCNISAECQGDADCIDNICAETVRVTLSPLFFVFSSLSPWGDKMMPGVGRRSDGVCLSFFFFF